MVKSDRENAVARAQSAEDKRSAEGRHFSGTLPRSMEAFAAGLGASVGSPRRTNGRDVLDPKDLCPPQGTKKKMRGLDFGDAIGKELQNLYDDLVAQPVPDRFLNLLNQLEKNVVSSGVSSRAPGERE
ncbi:MAG: hypothetical protein CTY15_00725 [Methylocystis sp.]|nr:MAG: hypothetical protein CTY15_00725 [Methylocystis sp.]